MIKFLNRYFVLLVLSIILFSAICHGQNAELSTEDEKKAKAAFSRGRQSFEQQQFIDAANAFREAYTLMPAWKLLYNIGQAEAAAKRYGLALDSFEQYVALAGDSVDETRKEDVIKEITKLRAMVGFINITAPDGAIIFIDNVKRGVAPLSGSLKVTASIEHSLFVELNSEILLTKPILVSGAQTVSIDTQKETAAKEPPKNTSDDKVTVIKDDTPTQSDALKPNALITTGWILSGVGAGTLIGGAITGIIAVKKKGTLEDSNSCDGTSCDETKQGEIDSLDTTANLSTVLITTGGAIATAGIILLILGNKKDNEKLNVSANPIVAPGFSGFQIMGSF